MFPSRRQRSWAEWCLCLMYNMTGGITGTVLIGYHITAELEQHVMNQVWKASVVVMELQRVTVDMINCHYSWWWVIQAPNSTTELYNDIKNSLQHRCLIHWFVSRQQRELFGFCMNSSVSDVWTPPSTMFFVFLGTREMSLCVACMQTRHHVTIRSTTWLIPITGRNYHRILWMIWYSTALISAIIMHQYLDFIRPVLCVPLSTTTFHQSWAPARHIHIMAACQSSARPLSAAAFRLKQT